MHTDNLLYTNKVNEQHILYYTITRNLNTLYENATLYEYGIECVLKNHNGNILSTQKVNCISSDFHKVSDLIQFLVKHQVYPIHLLEILDDLLAYDSLPNSKNTLVKITA